MVNYTFILLAKTNFPLVSCFIRYFVPTTRIITNIPRDPLPPWVDSEFPMAVVSSAGTTGLPQGIFSFPFLYCFELMFTCRNQIKLVLMETLRNFTIYSKIRIQSFVFLCVCLCTTMCECVDTKDWRQVSFSIAQWLADLLASQLWDPLSLRATITNIYHDAQWHYQ